MAADRFTLQQICPSCGGTGEVIVTLITPDPEDADPGTTTGVCPRCNGEEVIDWGYAIIPDAFFQKIVDDVIAALP